MNFLLKGKKYGCLILVFILSIGLLLWYKEETENVEIIIDKASFTVVVDPGHGGFDPGKVGVDGSLEKDINLEISLLLKELLEKENIKVVMTRTEDKAVGQGEGKVKKQDDMKKRVEIINESDANLSVSIHQNSFTNESSKGAQVFYHTQSTEGALLAKIMQEQIKLSVKDENTRMEKANDSYYLLKKTTCPIVIVECGFLSNYEEARLLNDIQYQNKIAEGIFNGIKIYLEMSNEKSNHFLRK